MKKFAFPVSVRNIVKKSETVSNCDKSYCAIAKELDTAMTEIKRLKEENIKLSEMAINESRKAQEMDSRLSYVLNREDKIKSLINEIMDELNYM